MSFLNNKDRVGSSFILLAALLYLQAAFDIPVNQVLGDEVFTARTIPISLSLLTIFVCLIQMFLPAKATADETISETIAGFHWQPCLLLTVLMLVFSLTFNYFGFLISTFLFLFIGISMLKEKRYLLSAAVSAGVALFMWLILTQAFEIYLDSGGLYRSLAAG